MLESSLAVATSLISLLEQHWGAFGLVVGSLIVWGIPIVSLLIEVAEFVVEMTPSKRDDAFVQKARLKWEKILPWMEILPHVNVPLSAAAIKVLKLIKRLAAWLKARRAKTDT